MASIFRKALTKVQSLIPGLSRSDYERVLVEDSDVDYTEQASGETALNTPKQRAAKRILLIGLISSSFILLVAWAFVWVFVWEWSQPEDNDYSLPCSRNMLDEMNYGFQCHPEISHYWGQYSPYFTVPSKISANISDSCEVTFVQTLARHGARDPTFTKAILYTKLIDHIREKAVKFEKKYAFLESYKWTWRSDQLTDMGAQQLLSMGYKNYQRYQHLAKDTIPFVRTTNQDRIRASASWWMEGFETARQKDPDHTGERYPYGYPAVVISEEPGYNNTLSHNLCTSFESGPFSHGGIDAQAEFAATFVPPIQARVNKNLKGANLTPMEIIYLMDLCPFDTVAAEDSSGRKAAVLSPFCHLFTTSEWRSYDYYQSVGKFYGFAHGNPMGPTQGVGFANELIARLTNSPVIDHTSTNSTLTGSQKTFPTGKNVTMFADFSHDNDMIAIFSALGLLNATKPLNKKKIQTVSETGGYSTSWVVPFAARAYFEKMRCAGEEEELVRVLINDRVIPLQNCGADDFGRCKLGAFVGSLGFARQGGNWDQCFV